MGTLDDLLPIRRLLDAAGNVLTFARDLAIDSSLAWSNNATTRVATLSLSGKSTQRVVSGTAYVCDSVSTDFLLDVDTSVSSAAKLPAPSVGRVIWFVDKTGTASTNSFTIKRFGAETINGSAADLVVNANRAMVRLESDGTNWFAALFTPTVGGGSVPTGTGWTHVTGGAQDAAANHGSVAGQIPVVNAGVTDAPFVSVSGDATLGSTGVVAVGQLSGFTSVVTIPNGVTLKQLDGTGFFATTGTIRTSPSFSIVGRNSTNVSDVTLIQWDGANNINIGGSTGVGILSLQGNSFTFYSSGAAYLDCASVNMRGAGHGTVMFTATEATQIVALTAQIQSTGATITPANGANALSAAQSKQLFLRCLAGATAAVTVTSTAAPAAGNIMLVKNETTQTITFAWSSGTGIAIPTATSMWVGSDGTNAIKLGAMT